MRLRVLSRGSDLAVLQADWSRARCAAAWPSAVVTTHTRSSQGDRDTRAALWTLPDKGLFTADLSEALVDGDADLVVHSWKDLPIEAPPATVVAATLERADPRDVLLVRRDVVRARPARLTVLTSSPRRAWQLEQSLRAAAAVAGRRPSRTAAGARQHPDAAAQARRGRRRRARRRQGRARSPARRRRARGVRARRCARRSTRCRWMVLPLREFPTAPAQGALAHRSRVGSRRSARASARVTHKPTWRRGRAASAPFSQSFGGGCHAALGVTVLPRRLRPRRQRARTQRRRRRRGRRGRSNRGSEAAARRRARRSGRGPTNAIARRAGALERRGACRSAAALGRARRRPAGDMGRPTGSSWSGPRAAAPGSGWPRAVSGCTARPTVWAMPSRRPSIGWRAVRSLAAADARRLGRSRTRSRPTSSTRTLPDDLGSRTHFFWTSGSLFLRGARAPSGDSAAPGTPAAPAARRARFVTTLGIGRRVSVWLDYEQWHRARDVLTATRAALVAAAAAADARTCAIWSRRRRSRSRSSSSRSSSSRASTGSEPIDGPRRQRASRRARRRSTSIARDLDAGVRHFLLFPVPARQGASTRSTSVTWPRTVDAIKDALRRRAAPVGRHLPVRVHDARPLRAARRRAAASTSDPTLDALARSAVDGGRRRRRRRQPERHDGRPDGAHPRGARRRRPRPRADHELQHEVREPVLRPVPRRGGLGAAVRQSPALPDRRAIAARRDRVERALRRRGRRPADGEAGDDLARSDRADRRDDRAAGRRLPGQRRVREPRARWPSAASPISTLALLETLARAPPRRRGVTSSRTARAARVRSASHDDARRALRRARSRPRRAASTVRCARFTSVGGTPVFFTSASGARSTRRRRAAATSTSARASAR